MIWLVLLLRFINLCAAAVVAGGQLVVLLVIVPTKKRFATRTSVEVHNAMLGHQIDSFMKPCGITSISAALVILVLNFFPESRQPVISIVFLVIGMLGTVGVIFTSRYHNVVTNS